jgi:hypothetical protein
MTAFMLAVLAILGVTGCAAIPQTARPTITQTRAVDTPDASTAASPAPTADPYPGWTTYTNETFGLTFRYPMDLARPGCV